MKFRIIIPFILFVVTSLGAGCEKAMPEFVHSDNLISQLACDATNHGSIPRILGRIIEYDKDGNELPAGFSLADSEGGSGVIIVTVPYEERKTFDLTSVFLRASIYYDAVIYPSLTNKRHDILVTEDNPGGLLISVKSGIGSVRNYRIMGYYAQ